MYCTASANSTRSRNWNSPAGRGRRLSRIPSERWPKSLTSCNAINPLECEGYIAVDRNFNRIKIKSPQYVALAHTKDSMSARSMMQIIRANESDEFLNYFPEFRPLYDDLRGKFDALCKGLDNAYEGIRDIADQKLFAAEAVKTRCSSALFAMRKGTCKTAREYFATCTFPSLERTLGIDLSTYAVDGAPDAEKTE